MTTDLAGANYNAPIGNEDLIFQQGVYRDEFLERMRLMFGHPDFITEASWGIVAETDPSTVTETDLEPLVVTDTDLSVNVRAGMVVTKSGHWVALPNGVVEKGVATTDNNGINVVTLRFYTTDPDEQTPDVYGDPVFRQRIIPDEADRVCVLSLEEWNDLTSTEQADYVPIALATVVTDTATGDKSLTITHYSTSNTWLRPWFSPVDIEHRKMVGSGTVSSTNPHGQSWNDQTVGSFTLPQLMSHIGLVVSKDVSVPNVPGSVCNTEVPSGLIKTDDASGTITGVPNTKYINLGYYPTALGAVYSSSAEYVFAVKPRSTIIYQPSGAVAVPASTDLTVRAARTTTLEPPAGDTLTDFQVGAISSNDAVLASGEVLVSTMSVTLTDQMSADAGPIPAFYRFYFADRKVVKNPQVLMCSTLLTDITGSGVTPSITQFGAGVVLVAMHGAAAGASLSVKVRITGTDSDGAALTEVLTFDSTWTEPSSLPECSTWYTQWQRGTSVFATVTDISLDESLNAGENAAIQVYVLMDPVTTEELSYAALLAEGQWDGTKLCSLNDLRRIHYDLQLKDDDDPGIQAAATCALIQEPSQTRRTIYVEDFRRPIYGSLAADASDWSPVFNPDIIWNTDRTSGKLDHIYESRAFHMPNGALFFRVVFTPYNLSERHVFNQTYVWWRTQNSGIWQVWSFASTTVGANYVHLVPASGTTALRLRIFGWDLTGMVVIEYTA
jgi:hypothetical protein